MTDQIINDDMQKEIEEGILWWFCPNEECNPDYMLEEIS
jgi:hypothetical protein